MLNLPPQAVSPASAAATANPASPPRHRPPEAPRERFSQALDNAITAEPKAQTPPPTQPPTPSQAQAASPERARPGTRPAQGTDSARDKRAAPAAKASDAAPPAADAARRPAVADEATEADAEPAADEHGAAAPDNLGALLAQLRLGPAAATAAARGVPAGDGVNTAPEASGHGRHAAQGGVAGHGTDRLGAAPGPDRAGTAHGADRAGASHGADRAGASHGADRAGASLGPGRAGTAHGLDRAGTALGADGPVPAAGTAGAPFDDHLANARIAAGEPATRPGEAPAAPAAAWVTASGAIGGSAPASGAAPAEATLPAPPGSADFGTQLGAQITTFVREGVEHARLHLNPADMGPVSVQIQLDGATAMVQLGAEHAGTRQALEQAMPTLAASLREAGLTLTGGGVSDQARQGPGGQAASDGRPSRGDTDPAGLQGLGAAAAGAPPARPRGVVDLVA